MKKILCSLMAAVMLVTSLSVSAYGANYTEIDLGTKYSSTGVKFFGGIGQIWLDTNDVSKPLLIDKNGKSIAQYSNGSVFVDAKPNGNYYSLFTSYDSMNVENTTIFGNARTGKKPTEIALDVLALYGIQYESLNISAYPMSRGADYTVITLDGEYPYLKYLYDSDGNRAYDRPIIGLIDRGNVWLEVIHRDGSSLFINRLDWTTAEAPEGRYSTSSGIGVKQRSFENFVRTFDVYNEANELLFSYTSDEYSTNQADMIWVDGYCIVSKIVRHKEYYGMIDTYGNVVIPLEYAALDYPENGVLRAAVYETGMQSDRKYYGLIDMEGNPLCEFEYGYITPFENGVAAFREYFYDDRGGYIDLQGNVIRECGYYYDANLLGEYNVYTDSFLRGLDSSEIYAEDSKITDYQRVNDWALYDKNGKQLSKTSYSHIGPFSEGLAPAYVFNVQTQSTKVGFIDTKGNEVIPCIYTVPSNYNYYQYDDAILFTDGATILEKNGRGYIIHNPLITNGVAAPKNSAAVMVDGKKVNVDAYNINGNNYFKLRDIAALLNGSEKQFNVVWNEKKKNIEIEKNAAYKAVGGELQSDGKTKNTAKLSLPIVYCDGVMINEFDYETNQQLAGLKAYNIGGNNYFKLRDLGDFIDFHVGWDDENRMISIDTSLPYTS